jgi:hypothetical protein
VANPYPTGTFTLPETPSLSWRDNAGPQPHRGAVQRHAYHKRTTLPGVGCRPWFGIHARSALGGFDGRFSIETEIIVAIPPTLTRDIIRQRGWLFPLPPVMLDRVKALRR